MERHMRELLVPVFLIVGMVKRLVEEGLAVTSLEARDHQPGAGIIEHLVAEDPEQFRLKGRLVVLWPGPPAQWSRYLAHARGRRKDFFTTLDVNVQYLSGRHPASEGQRDD